MNIFFPLFLSLGLSFLFTALVIKFAPKLGITDLPNKREKHPATIHTNPVSRGGGIPVFGSVLITSLVFLPFSQTLSAILIGAALILGVGILDDRKPVSPYFRLLVNIVAGSILILSGIKISFFTHPFGGIFDITTFTLLGLPIIAWGASLVWIVFMTNIVSWSSGVDGQLAGFVPLAAGTLGALSLRFSQDIAQWPVIIMSAILAGAYLGLLFWSSFPQKIMPGYSGGALAGFLLGALAILSGAKVATLLVALGIPVIDAIFVIARRILTGKSPIKPDKGHLHHRLLAAGWGKPTVALFYWGLTALLGALVLHLNAKDKFYTIVMLVVAIGGLITWLTFWPLLGRRARDTG